MTIATGNRLSFNDRPDTGTAPYCQSRVWARDCTQQGPVKPVSTQCKQHDKIYPRPIIQPLCLQPPQTHHSNPHSAAVVSRGFLP
jgi:hypothetical protein